MRTNASCFAAVTKPTRSYLNSKVRKLVGSGLCTQRAFFVNWLTALVVVLVPDPQQVLFVTDHYVPALAEVSLAISIAGKDGR